MRRTLITLAVFVLALAVGGFLFAWSGLYNIAASQGHWPTTRWLLEFGLRNSVETHTLGLDVPPLDDPSLVHRGAGHYQGGCLPCHGAPGEPRNLIVRQMLPEPPYLVGQIPTWEPEELFWIVKHGIKYAGMPAWVAQQRDDEVWAMVAFLQRLPELSAEEYRRLALGPLDPPPGPLAGEGARLLALGGVPWDSLTACARCHGLQGEGGGAGGFPRLAGQSEAYLYGALQSYAVGSRPSGVMQPVAAELTDQEMRDLAAYFAAFDDAPSPPGPVSAEAQTLELGARIATAGLPEFRIPACAACHGPGGGGKHPLFPAIAGQYADYIAQQLWLWRTGRRGTAPTAQIMAAAVRNLTEEQSRAVALYYSSLRPGDDTAATVSQGADASPAAPGGGARPAMR